MKVINFPKAHRGYYRGAPFSITYDEDASTYKYRVEVSLASSQLVVTGNEPTAALARHTLEHRVDTMLAQDDDDDGNDAA
jgi:hypothetical protein